MTVEDTKEYKRNAIEFLKKNTQYATAKATEEAFDLLIWFEETKENLWKRFDYKEMGETNDVLHEKINDACGKIVGTIMHMSSLKIHLEGDKQWFSNAEESAACVLGANIERLIEVLKFLRELYE